MLDRDIAFSLIKTEGLDDEGRVRFSIKMDAPHFNLVFAGGDRLAQLARIAAEVIPAIEARAND